MAVRVINSSELILNSDKSVFHLHLKKGDVADNIILVGDPSRVDMVTSFFSETEKKVVNREFVSVVGRYKDVRFTVVSTGIGQDNIDIVLNELDALVNVDFDTMTPCEHIKSLNIVRIGTSGGVQDSITQNSRVISQYSIGMDHLLHFYKDSVRVRNRDMERVFIDEMNLKGTQLENIYIVKADESLTTHFEDMACKGITMSAPGFYAPQGRWLRLEPTIEDMISKLNDFSYDGMKITNIEMESSAVAGLSLLMGHRAVTMCLIIAQRSKGSSNSEYKDNMVVFVKDILDKMVLFKASL